MNRNAFPDVVGFAEPLVGFSRSPGWVWLSSPDDTPDDIQEKFIAAASSDTVRSPTRTGKSARPLRTAWQDEWTQTASPDPLAMPLQPLLVSDAWARTDEASAAGHEGAQQLESFCIGQVVGSFQAQRPASEIARELIDDCNAALVRLGERGSG